MESARVAMASPDLVVGSLVRFKSKLTGYFFKGKVYFYRQENSEFGINRVTRTDLSGTSVRLEESYQFFLSDIEDLRVIPRLPYDIVSDILARRKEKDGIYFSFYDSTANPIVERPWFTMRTNKDGEDVFAAEDVVPDNHEWIHRSKNMFAFGTKIIMVCGQLQQPTTVWIFETRTSILRQAPTMPVTLHYQSAGLVADKLYIFGNAYGADERIYRLRIQAVTFHLRSETWGTPFLSRTSPSVLSASVDDNIYFISRPVDEIKRYYNTRDNCLNDYMMPPGLNPFRWWPTGMCVMDNVFYNYDTEYGLRWYDITLTRWKMVSGSTLIRLEGRQPVKCLAMNEYYGKLALFWTLEGSNGSGTVEAWCTKIILQRTGTEIQGEVEEFKSLGTLPSHYSLSHCVSVFG